MLNMTVGRQMLHLADPSLLRDECLIDGEWIPADSGRTFEVNDPATGDRVGTVPSMGMPETRRALEAAQAAWPEWRARTGKERAAIDGGSNSSWQIRTIWRCLTTEQGKPLAEAKGEVAYGASFVEWFAEEAKRIYGDTIPEHRRGVRIVVLKQPVGVVAAITPWNFPIAMITRKCAPALAAGCPVVIKPAEATPLSALAVAVLAERAGFPRGVINVVTGEPREIGLEMTRNPIVRKLSFTGSTPVGKMLMRQASDTVTKVSLELGGNAPFIVFDDADLDAAVTGAIQSKFRNAGQTCVCANRIFVQTSIYEGVCGKVRSGGPRGAQARRWSRRRGQCRPPDQFGSRVQGRKPHIRCCRQGGPRHGRR